MENLMNHEKHYVTLNNYLKSIYHEKVFKVSLNGNFSCPNRDGKISYKGCLFCSDKGSGDFAGERGTPIKEQFKLISSTIHNKWKEGSYIAYFQANTNTYGSVSELRKRYDALFENGKLIDDKIKILSIATRPDCLSEDILSYLEELSKKISLWVELGFQTSNELTALGFNRGYNNECFKEAVLALKKIGVQVIVHIINGLPGDSSSDMIATARYLSLLPIDGIKIHMLHIIKNSPYGQTYSQNPFPLLTLEEYVLIVAEQLRLLPKNVIIHRITGDADKAELIAPSWTLKKFIVMNEIDKYMRKMNYYQGDLYVQNH